jgi:hypothetical protein
MPQATLKRSSTSKNSSKNRLLKSAKGSKSAPHTLATKASSHQSTRHQRREESDGEQPHPKKQSRHQAALNVKESVEELEASTNEKVVEDKDEDVESDLDEELEVEVSHH